MDADVDNVYMVTVVATDDGTSTDRSIGVDKLTATRDVVITVANADDPGTVALSSVQPKVGIDLVATLADEDGGVKDVTWQWYNDTIVESNLTVGRHRRGHVSHLYAESHRRRSRGQDPVGKGRLHRRIRLRPAPRGHQPMSW